MKFPFAAFCTAFLASVVHADDFPVASQHSPGAPTAAPNLVANIERPLRYHPDHGDFVIENGTARFNRPLHGRATAFRIEASDRPEFGFYAGGKAGVIYLGIRTAQGERWLTSAAQITARYRPGSMIYEVRDPLLGDGVLTLTALPTKDAEGLVLRAEFTSAKSGAADAGVEFIWTFGGAGKASINNRNGDIMGGNDRAKTWELWPADCAGQNVTTKDNTFELSGKAGTFRGTASTGSELKIADCAALPTIAGLLAAAPTPQSVVVGRIALKPASPVFLVIQRAEKLAARTAEQLPAVFAAAETYRQEVVSRVIVDTPDAFVNAAAAAIAISGDALWAGPVTPTVMHGNVAWRMPLLGWRGQYVLDAYGWHDRAREHFRYWAAKQNTDAASISSVPHADPAKNLATDDWKTLQSHGAIPSRHYDMNLVFVDALMRHLLWTGDTDFAREMWPFLKRHLAWEKRLFDRDGLYEAYCCIWASDALTYNGGGAAHSTAYNFFHNTMAARIARALGEDPAPYEAEAARIHTAMQRELWLPAQGWYAEYKELLGLKRTHTAAALWTVYHTIDSRVPDAFQAWQTTRYVDTQLAPIPVRGPGVPTGDWFTVSSSNWQPYEWSLNNVYLGETAHTALAYWQAGRADAAWRLWKGSVLDAMYMGLNPGNLPNLSQYDVFRRETYRDFGDSTGSTARSLIEGLFGITPDALAGELALRPGFPAEWDHASIRTPDVSYAYQRSGEQETFLVEARFAKPLALRLCLAARAEKVISVEVNGAPATWANDATAIGAPRLLISAPAAARSEIVIRWSGAAVVGSVVSKTPGSAAQFEKISRGDFTWWQPIEVPSVVDSPSALTANLTVSVPAGATCEHVDLTALFNDSVTQIFKNEYLAPRSPHVSLSMPKQGIGSWSAFGASADIDDTGVRRLAAEGHGAITLPSGATFRTPGEPAAKNAVFTSQWDNYPHDLTAPLSGSAQSLHVLVVGSTGAMQSQIDNGEIVVTYADGTTARLALHNPTTWWPIEQDYQVDDYAFRRDVPAPQRIALKTGRSYLPKGFAKPSGGAATVLALPLDPKKPLRSLTVRTLSTEVIVGLMAATLVR